MNPTPYRPPRAGENLSPFKKPVKKKPSKKKVAKKS